MLERLFKKLRSQYALLWAGTEYRRRSILQSWNWNDNSCFLGNEIGNNVTSLHVYLSILPEFYKFMGFIFLIPSVRTNAIMSSLWVSVTFGENHGPLSLSVVSSFKPSLIGDSLMRQRSLMNSKAEPGNRNCSSWFSVAAFSQKKRIPAAGILKNESRFVQTRDSFFNGVAFRIV